LDIELADAVPLLLGLESNRSKGGAGAMDGAAVAGMLIITVAVLSTLCGRAPLESIANVGWTALVFS